MESTSEVGYLNRHFTAKFKVYKFIQIYTPHYNPYHPLYASAIQLFNVTPSIRNVLDCLPNTPGVIEFLNQHIRKDILWSETSLRQGITSNFQHKIYFRFHEISELMNADNS